MRLSFLPAALTFFAAFFCLQTRGNAEDNIPKGPCPDFLRAIRQVALNREVETNSQNAQDLLALFSDDQVRVTAAGLPDIEHLKELRKHPLFKGKVDFSHENVSIASFEGFPAHRFYLYDARLVQFPGHRFLKIDPLLISADLTTVVPFSDIAAFLEDHPLIYHFNRYLAYRVFGKKRGLVKVIRLDGPHLLYNQVNYDASHPLRPIWDKIGPENFQKLLAYREFSTRLVDSKGNFLGPPSISGSLEGNPDEHVFIFPQRGKNAPYCLYFNIVTGVIRAEYRLSQSLRIKAH